MNMEQIRCLWFNEQIKTVGTYLTFRRGMADVGAHDHDRPFEGRRPALLGQLVVDPSQLAVDLQAQVGDHLADN